MFDLRPVLFICGILLATLAGVMCVPAAADALVGNPDWQAFVVSALITGFVGGALILTSRAETIRLNVRQAFVFTALSWLSIAAFGALPFALADLPLTVADAFFESMSGITTTGSTVIENLDEAPPGILLWRALLQWMGGIGIIVVAIGILPVLQVGGMQLFHMESSDTSEKVLPRVTQIASYIAFIYVSLTALCASLYGLAGMNAFDAVAHSMTTVATGGFSTHDLSLGHFGTPAIEWIAILFMLSGALPFALYVQAVRGRPRELLRDSQVQWFLSIVACGVAAMTVWHIQTTGSIPAVALREAMFNTVSVITGTGYATAPFDEWGGFAVAAFSLFMFIGGCAGSTSCGIKVFRFQILYETTRIQMARLIQPHGVFLPYFNHRPVSEHVTASVMGFFFLFIVAFAVLALILGLLGLDFITSVSGAATAIANVGPGLGETIGPSTTFKSIPEAAKWVLAAGMLLGRLELFTVLVLFVPSFWRG